MAAEMSYLANYNSLLDEHLGEYLSRPTVWRHLRRQGLVKRSGEVVGEEEWRASVHRRDARAKMDRGRLEQQQERARGEDTLRRAAKRKHRQQQSNYALADRVRLQAEAHHPGYVREWNFAPLSKADRQALGIRRRDVAYSDDVTKLNTEPGQPLREMLTGAHSIVRTDSTRSSSRSHSLASCSARSVYRESPYIPRPPTPKETRPGYKLSPKRDPAVPEHIPSDQHRRRVIKSVNGGTPRAQSQASVTLLYRGRGIRLNGRTVHESGSDVSVYQQHCGGNAVLVYQGLLGPGDKFSFVSRRHLDSTLGLTFYLNGLVDARVSACCEYRYKPGHKVGGAGRTCHYEWLSVRDATPCFRCQAEIEVNTFIAAGEPVRNSPKHSTVLREAWVNTSPLGDEQNGTSRSPAELVEMTNATCKTEDIIPESRETAGLIPTEAERGSSRRSSLSSESDATSSVTLDSDLNETPSEYERGLASPAPGTRDYCSSLGHVTPDDRLLAPSALSGNPPSISEEVEAVDSREQFPAVCADAVNINGSVEAPVINLIGVDGTDLAQSLVATGFHSPTLSVSTDSGDSGLRKPGRTAPDSPTHSTCSDASISSESDSDKESMVGDYPPYTISEQCLTIRRNITDDQLEEFIPLLQDNAINTLSIEDTRNFTPQHLMTILAHIQNIKTLRLLGNEISQDQLNILLEHLQHTASLEISHSLVPPGHFITFLNSLAKAAPNLTELNASNCNIEFDKSVTKLLNSLVHLNCLNLSGNVLKSAILFDSLHMPRLEELRLDSAQLEERDLLELCEFMRGNATIHTLSLRENILSNAVLQRLLDMLQINRTLVRLLFNADTRDASQMQQHINVKLISDILDKRAI